MRFLLKKTKKIILFYLISCSSIYGNPPIRESSAPFISGDTFRSFADHLFDETSQLFEPLNVNYGDVIFVKGDMLGDFFQKKHFYIHNPYVLICHNSDEKMPGQFSDFLDDPKILAWFAQNIEEYSHPKLIHLPIGLANRCWEHGSIESILKIKSNPAQFSKNHLVYLNIVTSTYPKERELVYNLFKGKPYCLAPDPKSFEDYLKDIASCKFVLSPRGNGIDCHRTWEALFLGSIPIVKSSSLDPMYENLPVIIVNNWDEVTEKFLERTYQEMLDKQYNFSKLTSSYWHNEITKYKKKNPDKKITTFEPDKKIDFYFSNEPIDVVIPCVEKDLETLNRCIKSIRKYCNKVRRIIVISPKKLTDSAEWFEESNFPFTKTDIALALTKSKKNAINYLKNSNNRCGWIFQQLLKLYAPSIIPNISSNVLIVDADVIFLNSVSFQDPNGAPLFNISPQYHPPYFDHMNKLIPGLTKVFSEYSGITHHMLFQHSILKNLFQTVEDIHNQKFWQVFCNCIDPEQLYASGASEYEIYFNFSLTKCSKAKIRPLKNTDVESLNNINEYKKTNHTYVAWHSYNRRK